MTPEAVVFRCLQLGTSAEFEAGLFAELVAADADLAAHWFGLLGLPADASALQGYLEKLDPTDRDQLVQAQENRLTQYSSSVRLGMQQWLAALEAALWGSILWRMMASEHDHRFDTETRFLLALSGVQGVDDEDVQSLERFRSARVELLEDAPLAHRIFAVIDRVSQGQADHVAEQLLLLPGEEIAQSKVLASQELDDKVHRLGLGTQVEADWAHSIWLRRQINSVSAALRDTDDREALLRTHMTLSKTVFSISPLLLLVNHGAACLYSPLAPDLSIRTASQSSYIARALRTNSSVELIDSVELPVADRQALAQLEQIMYVVNWLGESIPHISTIKDHFQSLIDKLIKEKGITDRKRRKSDDNISLTRDWTVVDKEKYEQLLGLLHFCSRKNLANYDHHRPVHIFSDASKF